MKDAITVKKLVIMQEIVDKENDLEVDLMKEEITDVMIEEIIEEMIDEIDQEVQIGIEEGDLVPDHQLKKEMKTVVDAETVVTVVMIDKDQTRGREKDLLIGTKEMKARIEVQNMKKSGIKTIKQIIIENKRTIVHLKIDLCGNL